MEKVLDLNTHLILLAGKLPTSFPTVRRVFGLVFVVVFFV